MGFRPIDPALRREAVKSVLDDKLPVLSACNLYGIGATALRRYVDQERRARARPPLSHEQVATMEAEMTALRARVNELEEEQVVLKKQLPSHWERLLGKPLKSSKR